MADTASPDKEPSAPPVFGAASGLASGGGFGSFGTGVQPAARAETSNDGGEEETAATEEECAAEFKPLVELQEVETVSGEEEEKELCNFKSKLYRYDSEAAEWKERGVGQLKLLEHKETHKIRLLFRQEKTLKIRANHIVMPGTKLQEHSGNEKAWVYSTMDFADETQKMELFCLRFSSVERAQEFKGKFEEAMATNEKLLEADEAAEAGEAAPPADDKKAEDTAAEEEVTKGLSSVEVKDE